MPVRSLDGFEIDMLDQGPDSPDGSPVLLLHSAGMGAAQWRALIGRMNQTWRLGAPNQLGYGRTRPAGGISWAKGMRADLESELAVAAAALRSLGAAGRSVHVVGHSMGALLALTLAARGGAGMASLTVIEPVTLGTLRSEGEDAALDEVGAMIQGFCRAYEGGNIDAAMRCFTDYWYGTGAWDKIPKAQRLPIFARANKMYADVQVVWDDAVPLADYAAIGLPTLVLTGGRTTNAARRMAALLAGALPDASADVVPLAGHMVPVTHSDLLQPLLEAHFRTAEGR